MRVFLSRRRERSAKPYTGALIAFAGHEVVALARSRPSAGKIARLGATVVRGDIGIPDRWLLSLPDVDGVIQMACDFDSREGETEQHLLDGLPPVLALSPQKVRFIHTGGCWLFGPTGNNVATEPALYRLSPLPPGWCAHLQRVLTSNEVEGIVIHPAMVYGGDGGVFRRFEQDHQGAIERFASSVERQCVGRSCMATIC